MKHKERAFGGVNTKIVRPNAQNIGWACDILRSGGVVAMPTETVYGLAANAYDVQAIQRIFEAKGRPQDNPLIVHISETEALFELAEHTSELAVRLAQTYWPGPLTMILPKSSKVPDIVTAGLPTVAIRLPAHSAARKLISEAGFALAAPSANLSGKPSPTSAMHVLDDLHGRIPLILDGGDCQVGLESTVVKIDENRIRLLRPGAITVDMLQQVCSNVEVDRAVMHPLKEGQTVVSPGMKYKHYSPEAEVILVDGSSSRFCQYVSAHREEGTYVVAFESEKERVAGRVLTYSDRPQQQAKELFGVLRRLDEVGARKVYVHCPSQQGVGLAVYNRLLRAAAFRVISL